jgi:hypothetical protein
MFVLLCFGVDAYAATYYVAKTGSSDTNPCTAEAPCLTIKRGLSRLKAGDVLEVEEGTYDETSNRPNTSVWLNVPSGFPNRYTTLRAAEGAEVWVQPTEFNSSSGIHSIMSMGFGGQHHVKVENINLDASELPQEDMRIVYGFDGLGLRTSDGNPSHHLIFEGMEIRGTTGHGFVLRHNYAAVIREMHIHDGHSAEGVSAAAACLYLHPNPRNRNGGVLENSLFENCDLGIKLEGWSNYIIRNNVVTGMGSLTDAAHGDGIMHQVQPSSGWRPTNGLLYNNVIHGVAKSGITFAGDGSDYTNVKVYNNTIYDAGLTCISDCSGQAARCPFNASDASLIKNNICHDVQVLTNLPAGNFDEDPLFMDAASGDFRLQEASGAIDAGVSLPQVSTDMLGVKRPQPSGGKWDMGAFEFEGVIESR